MMSILLLQGKGQIDKTRFLFATFFIGDARAWLIMEISSSVFMLRAFACAATVFIL